LGVGYTDWNEIPLRHKPAWLNKTTEMLLFFTGPIIVSAPVFSLFSVEIFNLFPGFACR
jgi:hypothetical protein